MNRRTEQPISRRELLRTAAALGGLAAATSFLEACTSVGTGTPTDVSSRLAGATRTMAPLATSRPDPTASPQPTSTPAPSPSASPEPTPAPDPTATEAAGGARVAFVKTRDRTEGVRQALALLGLDGVGGQRVLLKPNFNSADPAPGSTHDDVLRTLVQALWDGGAQSITVADRSGMGNTRSVMEQKGIFDLAQELGFEVLVLDELEREDWVMVQPPESHWQQGFPVARPFVEAGAVVQTCCLKTHRYGGHFTLSLKNSVGMVAKYDPDDGYNYMSELHSSAHQRHMIAETNAAYEPALIVMDGVEAFVQGGPATGERVEAQVMLAATDRVALDAVGVALLRHFGTTPEVSQGPIFEQEQIARAAELGLGVDSPEKIRLVTGDPESEAYAVKIQELLRTHS